MPKNGKANNSSNGKEPEPVEVEPVHVPAHGDHLKCSFSLTPDGRSYSVIGREHFEGLSWREFLARCRALHAEEGGPVLLAEGVWVYPTGALDGRPMADGLGGFAEQQPWREVDYGGGRVQDTQHHIIQYWTLAVERAKRNLAQWIEDYLNGGGSRNDEEDKAKLKSLKAQVAHCEAKLKATKDKFWGPGWDAPPRPAPVLPQIDNRTWRMAKLAKLEAAE